MTTAGRLRVTLRRPALVCFNVLVMNRLITFLIPVLLAASLAAVSADDSKDKRPGGNETEKRKKEDKGLAKEDRESRKTNNPARVDWEKRREQMKNMSPEERLAKRKEIKERLEKRISELRDRQAKGTLSPQETRELERRQQILKRFEFEEQGGTRIERPKPVLTNSPLEK